MNSNHVTVDDTGAETLDSTSLATALYIARRNLANAQASAFGQTAPVVVLQNVAAQSNAEADAIVTYFQAHAVARIGAALAGIAKTPNPNNPSTLTAAPGVNVDLPIL